MGGRIEKKITFQITEGFHKYYVKWIEFYLIEFKDYRNMVIEFVQELYIHMLLVIFWEANCISFINATKEFV